MVMSRRTIPAGEFKAHCLRIMDEVQRQRVPVVITKRGKPVAKLVPLDDSPRAVFGCLAGRIEIAGDIVAPVVCPDSWSALP